jgi:tetratricopeptide (TPR) repeat protein
LFPLLLAISLALYANSFAGEFVFDDFSTLGRRDIREQSFVELADDYRPVRYLSLRIDEMLYGGRVWGYHVSNALFHGITAFVVFAVLRRLAGAGTALPGALLFAAHPVHTECVAYISGRRDILTTLFYLLGFLCWLEFRRTSRPRWIAAFLASYALAFFSKEMAVTLPAICLLHYVLLDPAFDPRRARLYGAALALLAIPAIAWVLLSKATTQGWHGGSMTSNFATSARLVPHYAGLLLFPLRLLGDHSYDAFPLSASFAEGRVLLSLAAITAGVGLALRARRRAPLVTFGTGWFLVTLLPVLHIRPFHEIAAEHYLYLPSVGVCLLAGLGFERLRARAGRRVAWAALGLVLVAFSVRTVVRNRDWRNSETFWRATAETAPRCARAHFNVGTVHAQRSEWKEAALHMGRAVEIKPSYLRARIKLGEVLLRLGRIDDARAQWEAALPLARADERAAANVGAVCKLLGRYEEAIQAYEQDLKEELHTKVALRGLIDCHRALGMRAGGDPDKALPHFRRALQAAEQLLLRRRDDPRLLRETASLAQAVGDRSRAAELRARADRLDPPGR